MELIDDQAWSVALEECYARVLRALIGACGSRERAEDGFQDALVDALKPGVRAHVQRPDVVLFFGSLRSATVGRAAAGILAGLPSRGSMSFFVLTLGRPDSRR